MRVRPGSEVLAGGTVHPAGAPPCEPAPQPVFASRPVEIPGSWWYLGDIPHGWAAAELIMLVRDLLFHLCRLGPVSAAVADGGPVLIDGADVHLLAGTTLIWIIGGVVDVGGAGGRAGSGVRAGGQFPGLVPIGAPRTARSASSTSSTLASASASMTSTSTVSAASGRASGI
jgi:hypothetical protein